MHLSRELAVIVVTGLVMWLAAHRSNPIRSPHLRPGLWQKVLSAVAVVFVVLMMLNPEFLALGIVVDSAFFDLLVLMIGLQLQLIGGQSWRQLRVAFEKLAIRVNAHVRKRVFEVLFAISYLSLEIRDSFNEIWTFAKRTLKRSRPRVIAF